MEKQDYQSVFDRSLRDPEGFWGEVAEDVHWYKRWDKVLDKRTPSRRSAPESCAIRWPGGPGPSRPWASAQGTGSSTWRTACYVEEIYKPFSPHPAGRPPPPSQQTALVMPWRAIDRFGALQKRLTIPVRVEQQPERRRQALAYFFVIHTSSMRRFMWW